MLYGIIKRAAALLTAGVMAFCLAACTVNPGVSTPTAAPTQALPTEEGGAQGDGPTAAPDETVGPDDPAASLPRFIAGDGVTFLITADGALYGWGGNKYGQVGDGTGEDRTAPRFVGTGLVPVIAGESVFALDGGTLYAWGRNDEGQLGTGDLENKLSPVVIEKGVASVCRCGEGTAALTEDGRLLVWGMGNYSDTIEITAKTPEEVLDNVASVTGGYAITLDGELYRVTNGRPEKLADGVSEVYPSYNACFCRDLNGRLFELANTRASRQTILLENVAAAVNAGGTVYAIDSGGVLWRYTAADNALGDDPDEAPVRVTEGAERVCAGIDMDEDWGYNYLYVIMKNGDLYAKTHGSEFGLAATGVKEVVTCGAVTYAITVDGELLASGTGRDGRDWCRSCIGNGTDESADEFVRIDLGGMKTASVAVTLDWQSVDDTDDTDYALITTRSYAVTEDGRVWAWGWNGDGLLGVRVPDEMVLSPTELYLTR